MPGVIQTQSGGGFLSKLLPAALGFAVGGPAGAGKALGKSLFGAAIAGGDEGQTTYTNPNGMPPMHANMGEQQGQGARPFLQALYDAYMGGR